MTIPAAQGLLALAEATPNSLDELMSRFPPSKEDIAHTVAHLRRWRSQWQMDEAAGKTKASIPKAAKAPKAPKAEATPAAPKLTAADLADEI